MNRGISNVIGDISGVCRSMLYNGVLCATGAKDMEIAINWRHFAEHVFGAQLWAGPVDCVRDLALGFATACFKCDCIWPGGDHFAFEA